MWQFKTQLLSKITSGSRKKITKEIQKQFETEENETTVYQNIWQTTYSSDDRELCRHKYLCDRRRNLSK